MNYTDFKNKCRIFPLILSKDLTAIDKNKQSLRNQLYRWQKKKLLIEIKKGIYLLNENDRKINPSNSFLANQLYSPSYVSLEYALNFYGLIPEKTADITSLTTKKTMRIKNQLGNFIYQHIKPAAFRGFKAAKDSSGLTFFIAEPEKAVVDFIYLNLARIRKGKSDIFKESFRFQNTETLKPKRLKIFAKLFTSSRLEIVVNAFCKFIAEERK